MTMTSFPRLGTPGVFTEPYYDPADAVSSHSLFVPEEITNPHARFPLVVLSFRDCHDLNREYSFSELLRRTLDEGEDPRSPLICHYILTIGHLVPLLILQFRGNGTYTPKIQVCCIFSFGTLL